MEIYCARGSSGKWAPICQSLLASFHSIQFLPLPYSIIKSYDSTRLWPRLFRSLAFLPGTFVFLVADVLMIGCVPGSAELLRAKTIPFWLIV